MAISSGLSGYTQSNLLRGLVQDDFLYRQSRYLQEEHLQELRLWEQQTRQRAAESSRQVPATLKAAPPQDDPVLLLL